MSVLLKYSQDKLSAADFFAEILSQASQPQIQNCHKKTAYGRRERKERSRKQMETRISIGHPR